MLPSNIVLLAATDYRFLVNLMAGLAAYTYLPKKPSRLYLPKRLACSASCRFLVRRTHVKSAMTRSKPATTRAKRS